MQTSTVDRHAPAPLTYQKAMEVFEIKDISREGIYKFKSKVKFPYQKEDGKRYILTNTSLSRYHPEKIDESLYQCAVGLISTFNLMTSITLKQTKASSIMTNLSISDHIDLLFSVGGCFKTEIERRGFGCCGGCKQFVKVLASETKTSPLKPVLDDKNKPIKYAFDEDFCRMVAQGLKHKMMQAAAQSAQPPQTTTVNPVFAYADIQAAQQLAAQFLGN